MPVEVVRVLTPEGWGSLSLREVGFLYVEEQGSVVR